MPSFVYILNRLTFNIFQFYKLIKLLFFISVLFVIIIARFFKSVDTKHAFNMLRWLVISYTIAIGFATLIQLITGASSFTRATGPYWFTYWVMLVGSCIFPFTLLYRRFANKKYFLLLVAVIMNLGWLFESFVIHVISIHRDYLPPSEQSNSLITYLLPFKREIIIMTKGLLLGIFVILTGNFILKVKQKKHIHDIY